MRLQWAVGTVVLAVLQGITLTGQETPARPSAKIACYRGYPEKDCREHLAALRAVLIKYQKHLPADWTWIIARSSQWRNLLQQRKDADPESPAFTLLEEGYTVLEEVLFATVPTRSASLMKKWQRPLNSMLEYAVTHELAHIICRVTDEAAAERGGATLREGGSLQCESEKSGRREIPQKQTLNRLHRLSSRLDRYHGRLWPSMLAAVRDGLIRQRMRFVHPLRPNLFSAFFATYLSSRSSATNHPVPTVGVITKSTRPAPFTTLQPGTQFW
jgi:hypothetical protein